MAIVVACRCGQAFEADAWLAGKVVQCPACRSPIAVPSPVAEMTPAYVPRQPPAVSRESRENAESMATFLAAGVVIFVVVLVLSVSVVLYLKRKSPATWIEKSLTAERQVLETPAAPQPPPPEAGVVTSKSAVPAGPPATALPSGWNFYEHSTGRFSAVFPDLPSTVERKIEATLGDSTIYLLTLTNGSHTYEASREFRSYAIPSGGEATTYESLLRARAGEMEEGKVEGSNNATVDGRLVCDAILRGKVEGKEVRQYLRLVVSGNSVFQLTCTVPPGSEQPANIKVFLGNYQLQ